MSLRTLKKLRGDVEIASQKSGDGQSVSDSEDGSERVVQPKVDKKKKKQLTGNPFSLLEGGAGSPSDTEAKEDDDKDGTSTNSHIKDPPPDPDAAKLIEETKHKNKKRRKSRLNKQRSSEVVLEEDDIDASIREVNEIYGEDIISRPTDTPGGASADQGHKSLLTISHKHLNPNNEMKKIFGSRVVHAEQSKKRGRHRSHSKPTWLVAHRSTWPPVEKLGVSMSLDEAENNYKIFRFEHSKQYQNVQFQFLDAVDSYNPENIAALIRMNPYHIDSLIQLSDAYRIGEDIHMAAELIERAIYSMESSFHPLFNITQGTCRLDYRRPENRSFFIAVYKHIHFIGQKGCYRTALEFSKLLLSLEPDVDPLSVLLYIDFYAIKSAQYEFLIRLYSEWEAARNLSMLPNLSFSTSLAKYHLSKEKGMESSLAEADSMIQNSLIMFPSVLLLLLEKCNVQPDPHVVKHEFFTNFAEESEPASLKLLVRMYIDQCFPLWKEVDVLEWLEKNVRATLNIVNEDQAKVSSFKTKRMNCFKAKLPVNICRHIILSEIKETFNALPQEVMKSPGVSYDPVPPSDSINSYSRPKMDRNPPTRSESVLSMFFRTMMPSFTAEQYQNRREEALLAMLENRERDAAQEEGAAAAAPAPAGSLGGTDLRRSVTSLLDAMRDLLSNIHLPEIPRDGDGDDEDSDDERED